MFWNKFDYVVLGNIGEFVVIGHVLEKNCSYLSLTVLFWGFNFYSSESWK
jgi:hypothetical protein